MTGAKDIAALVSAHRFPYRSEDELQERLGELFQSRGIEFKREVRISPEDRLDFMIGSVALEVKIASSRSEVLRQLHRYAQHEAVVEVVLVTCRAVHLSMPREINGKPIYVASLLGGSF